MSFRAIIYGVNKKISIITPNINGENWFAHQSRAYRVDEQVVCQLINKGNQIKAVVESIYIEGNPVPVYSNLKNEVIYLEHMREKFSNSVNGVRKGFFESILGR